MADDRIKTARKRKGSCPVPAQILDGVSIDHVAFVRKMRDSSRNEKANRQGTKQEPPGAKLARLLPNGSVELVKFTIYHVSSVGAFDHG